MELRQARPEDLTAIVAMEAANFAVEEQIAPEVIEWQLTTAFSTCLVLDTGGEVAAYILARPWKEECLTDALFEERVLPDSASNLAISSLSVGADYRRQGLGTLLLAGLKEVAVQKGYQQLLLTCHEELISYYEMNGFVERGLSLSTLGGHIWYEMAWQSPSQ